MALERIQAHELFLLSLENKPLIAASSSCVSVKTNRHRRPKPTDGWRSDGLIDSLQPHIPSSLSIYIDLYINPEQDIRYCGASTQTNPHTPLLYSAAA